MLFFVLFIVKKKISCISGYDFKDYEVCETLFYFSQKVILDLNATDECCLFNISDCHNGTDSPAQTVDRAKGKLRLFSFLNSRVGGVFVCLFSFFFFFF